MNVDALAARVQRLEDLEAIRRVKHEYCAYCDAGYDPEGIASLFLPEGIWDAGADFGRYVGREAIAGFFRNVGPSVAFAAHVVTNERIDVEGERARGVWWLVMPSTFHEDGRKVDRWLFSEYTDDFVKREGRWYIAHLRSNIHRNAPHLEGWANVAPRGPVREAAASR
jgi:hypothetical protein